MFLLTFIAAVSNEIAIVTLLQFDVIHFGDATRSTAHLHIDCFYGIVHLRSILNSRWLRWVCVVNKVPAISSDLSLATLLYHAKVDSSLLQRGGSIRRNNRRHIRHHGDSSSLYFNDSVIAAWPYGQPIASLQITSFTASLCIIIIIRCRVISKSTTTLLS